MARIKTVCFLMIWSSMACADGLDYPSVWQCDADKFNWYCDLEDESPATLVPTAPLGMEQIRTAEQMREELKRREDIAVMNPTTENVRSYIQLWQVVQDKSSLFADTWRRVVWQNPALDYTLKRPANNVAIKLYDKHRSQREEDQLRTLAQDHGLIFFFSSTCSYCQAMAPTLKMLSERHGLDVLAVSVDGGSLPEFPNPTNGQEHMKKWGVSRVPALFIGSKKTGDHAPIGFGLMALSEIKRRIFVLTNTEPGESF